MKECSWKTPGESVPRTYWIGGRGAWALSLVWILCRPKKLLLLLQIKPRFPTCPSNSLFTIPTTPCQPKSTTNILFFVLFSRSFYIRPNSIYMKIISYADQCGICCMNTLHQWVCMQLRILKLLRYACRIVQHTLWNFHIFNRSMPFQSALSILCDRLWCISFRFIYSAFHRSTHGITFRYRTRYSKGDSNKN